MDDAERMAETVVEAALPGAQMRYRNEREQSGDLRHDFDLRLPDGRRAVVEATWARDRATSETLQALRDHGDAANPGDCEKAWILSIKPHAHIKALKQRGAELLAQLEADGRTEFRSRQPGGSEVVSSLSDLGVVAGCGRDASEPTILIGDPRRGGHVSPGVVVEAVRREAQKEDNRNKLQMPTADERHLFVALHFGAHPCVSMSMSDPPEDPPSLPEEVTHAWVATLPLQGDGFLTWIGENGKAWTSLGVIGDEGVLRETL